MFDKQIAQCYDLIKKVESAICEDQKQIENMENIEYEGFSEIQIRNRENAKVTLISVVMKISLMRKLLHLHKNCSS